MKYKRIYEITKGFSRFTALSINLISLGLVFAPGNIHNLDYLLGLVIFLFMSLEIELFIKRCEMNKKKRITGEKTPEDYLNKTKGNKKYLYGVKQLFHMKTGAHYETMRSVAVFVVLAASVIAVGMVFLPGNLNNAIYLFGLFLLLVLSIEVWLITETKWKITRTKARRKR